MASKVSGMIEQINALSGSNNVTHNIASTAYGYCETAAGTAAKVVDMTGFKLVEGVTIHVKFKEKNSASNPTLNVNSTGAKNIVQYGTTAVSTTDETNGWYAGAVVSFTYDGTSWVRDQGFNNWRGIQDNLTSSTNTTQSLSAKQGYLLANGSARDDTKLPLAGGTMTGRLTTPKPINQIVTGSGTAGGYISSKYCPAKWTFSTGMTATDGDIITIKIPIAGHDYGVFMSIDGGTTYYPIVCNGTGRLTTHYPANTYLTLIFEPSGSAASMFALDGQTSSTRITVSGGVWRVINYYDSNSNDTGYYHRRIYPNIKAGNGGVHPYAIIMQLANGKWSSIVVASSTNPGTSNVAVMATGKTASSNAFLPGHVLLMYANAEYAADANIGTYNIWSAHSGLIDARYSFNLANSTGNGFVGYKPVYIVGTITDGLFTLDSTKWWTQDLPSTDDNKVYIYIGDAYDWYRLTFTEDKPIYWYKNGAIRLYGGDAATVNGLTVQTAVPQNAVFTDTNKYHKTGSWNGLTYTATAVNNADTLAFTIPTGTTATTVAVGNHTHSLSIATDTGTNALTFTANTKYKLTAGGSTYIFTTQNDATYLGNIGRLTNMNIDFGSTTYNSKFFISYADGNTTSNKPYQNAMILNIAWDNVNDNKYGAQIAIGNNTTPHLQLRGCNNGTWDTSWLTVLDSNNYTTYAWARPSSITTGQVIISSGTDGTTTLRSIKNMTSVGNLGWTSSSADNTILTTNTIAYWNGRYNSTSSNLEYYKGGAFGTMAKETAADYAKLASPALTGTPTAPTAANGTNTTQIATTAFVNNTLSYVNAMRFKGTLGTGGTITALPASHEAGDTYRVITAGTWAGKYCEVGTLIICIKDGTAAADVDWTSVETNEDGAVIGPASSTNGNIVLFDGTSGRIIKNSSYSPSSFAAASHGNHVPTTQTANNITFLRNDNSWFQLTKNEVNTLINLLDTGSSDLTANDYVITQYVGGGTTTTTYHRRPANKVINATLVKSALGTVSTTAKKFLKDTGSWTQVDWGDLTGVPSTFSPSSHTHPVSQLTWGGGVNLATSATANGQEWSIDLTPGSYTGTYWHVWSAKNSKTILACYPDDNKVTVPNGGLQVQKIIPNTGGYTAAKDNGSSSSNRYQPLLWTFNLGIAASALANGLTIIITAPSAGHDYGVFLSVDNGTTYKPIASNTGANRLTTHYPNGSTMILCYDASGQVNSVFPVAGSTSRTNITGGCWRLVSSYDDGNPGDWNVRQYTLKAQTAITAGHIIGGTDSGYNHIDAGTAFDIRYAVLYAGSNIGAGSGGSNNYVHHYAINIKNSSGNNVSWTIYKNLYIKGTIDGTTFTPISGGSPFVQDITASDDGYVYYYIGRAYDSTTAMTFDSAAKSIYWYKNGAIRPYTGSYTANADGSVVSISRNTETTIATINGKTVKIKIPASDNTWRPIGTGASDAMAGNTNVNNVFQDAITYTDYTNWRPLIWGNSNSGTEGFTPADSTAGVFTTASLTCQPSTGTIRIMNLKLVGSASSAITYTDGTTSKEMIKFIKGDANGHAIKIGGGALTVVGGGESAQSITPSATAEHLYLLADNTIYIEANADTLANRIGFAVTTGGAIVPMKAESANNNKQDIGTSSNKWANVYATTFNGALSGNASTATKWASAQTVYVTLGTASTTTTLQGGSSSAQTIGVNGTLGVGNGGTGATDAATARTNLGAAASSHTHGNIQNGGTLQTNDITIANGDKIIVTDSSDSSKIARTSISFDASTTTKALSQKGTWETFNNVTQTAKSDNVNYKVLTTTSASPTSGSAAGAAYTANVYINASASSISAVQHRLNVGGTDKALIQYNNTDSSIDFIFI